MSLRIEAHESSQEPCLDPCLSLTVGVALLVTGFVLVLLGSLISDGQINVDGLLKERVAIGLCLGGGVAIFASIPLLVLSLTHCSEEAQEATGVAVKTGECLACWCR